MGANLKSVMKKRRVFDEAFKRTAVELSYLKGSVQEAARELGIDPARITKWRRSAASQSHKNPGQPATAVSGLNEDQKQIRRLQKELKEAQLERDILKSQYSVSAVE